MSRRPFWLAMCIAGLLCSPAGADVGSLSLSMTPLQTPGTLDVDLTLNVTTTGASTPATGDTLYMVGSFYYPTPFGSATTYTYDLTYVNRTGVSNVFENTFSFTLPREGHWGYYGFVYGLTAASYSTSSYQYGTMDIGFGATAIPTATLPGLLLFGALLAGIGFFLLFRS